MHGAAALPVFLVIDVEPDCIRLAQKCQGRGVGQYLAVLKETNVLAAELDGASPCA
jgi:hypothetical protein